MKHTLIGIAILCAASLAHAQHGGSCVRMGTPLTTPSLAASITTDPAEQHATDAVLEMSMPKLYYDAGEPVVLTTHLRTQRGGDLDGGEITVDDLSVTADSFDKGHPGKRNQKGVAQGHGRYTVALGNEPGVHSAIVTATVRDASGHPAKRGQDLSYVVATGEIQFLDVVDTRTVGDALVVTLKVKTTSDAFFTVMATLASGSVAVAQVTRQFGFDHPGVSTIELYFQTSDIVEPGPYRLVDVMANGGTTGSAALAAAPHDVGQPFTAAHADHEPPPHRNDEGALVGGPYGQPIDPAAQAAAMNPGPDKPLSIIPPMPPEFGEADPNNPAVPYSPPVVLPDGQP